MQYKLLRTFYEMTVVWTPCKSMSVQAQSEDKEDGLKVSWKGLG